MASSLCRPLRAAVELLPRAEYLRNLQGGMEDGRSASRYCSIGGAPQGNCAVFARCFAIRKPKIFASRTSRPPIVPVKISIARSGPDSPQQLLQCGLHLGSPRLDEEPRFPAIEHETNGQPLPVLSLSPLSDEGGGGPRRGAWRSGRLRARDAGDTCALAPSVRSGSGAPRSHSDPM
jgi:hypothetical protein